MRDSFVLGGFFVIPLNKEERAAMAAKRLMTELREMQKEKSAVCDAAPKTNKQGGGDDLFHWWACIFGPVGTPYQGGLFYLDIDIPKKYPMEAPKVRFRTQIFHPNIHHRTGAICVDILKDAWTPALQIRTILESICSLLNNPNPDDPLVPSTAHLYVNNPDAYQAIAREWTGRYAQQTHNTYI